MGFHSIFSLLWISNCSVYKFGKGFANVVGSWKWSVESQSILNMIDTLQNSRSKKSAEFAVGLKWNILP